MKRSSTVVVYTKPGHSSEVFDLNTIDEEKLIEIIKNTGFVITTMLNGNDETLLTITINLGFFRASALLRELECC